MRGKAEAMGVKEIFIDDLREEFVRDYVFPMFRYATFDPSPFNPSPLQSYTCHDKRVSLMSDRPMPIHAGPILSMRACTFWAPLSPAP